MEKGIVKWFNNEKGYGFIEGSNNEDIFIHYSVIKQDGYKSLETGQVVKYEANKTNKGLQAKCVEEIENKVIEKNS